MHFILLAWSLRLAPEHCSYSLIIIGAKADCREPFTISHILVDEDAMSEKGSLKQQPMKWLMSIKLIMGAREWNAGKSPSQRSKPNTL